MPAKWMSGPQQGTRQAESRLSAMGGTSANAGAWVRHPITAMQDPQSWPHVAGSRRAMSATGVRFRRLVTSPMAQMLGTLVRLKRSTLIAPVFSSSSTPACTHPS